MEEDFQSVELAPMPTADAVEGIDPIVVIAVVYFAIHTAFIGFTFLLHFFDSHGRSRRSPEHQPRSALAYLRVFASEWFYGFGAVLLYPFGLLPPLGRRRFDPDGGAPIVLVHGYMMNRSCMFAIYWRLRRLGFRNVYTLNLSPMFGSIETIGARLIEDLRELCGVCGGTPLRCVGHSLGGLALRWCLEQAPSLAIERLVTIATPHGGSRAAVFGPGKNARQLSPASSFVSSLAPSPRAPIVSVYSLLDNIVMPAHSGAFGDRRVELQNYGHGGIILSGRAFDRFASQITGPLDAVESRR